MPTLTQSPKNTSTSCELHGVQTFRPNGGVDSTLYSTSNSTQNPTFLWPTDGILHEHFCDNCLPIIVVIMRTSDSDLSLVPSFFSSHPLQSLMPRRLSLFINPLKRFKPSPMVFHLSAPFPRFPPQTVDFQQPTRRFLALKHSADHI